MLGARRKEASFAPLGYQSLKRSSPAASMNWSALSISAVMASLGLTLRQAASLFRLLRTQSATAESDPLPSLSQVERHL